MPSVGEVSDSTIVRTSSKVSDDTMPDDTTPEPTFMDVEMGVDKMDVDEPLGYDSNTEITAEIATREPAEFDESIAGRSSSTVFAYWKSGLRTVMNLTRMKLPRNTNRAARRQMQ